MCRNKMLVILKELRVNRCIILSHSFKLEDRRNHEITALLSEENIFISVTAAPQNKAMCRTLSFALTG